MKSSNDETHRKNSIYKPSTTISTDNISWNTSTPVPTKDFFEDLRFSQHRRSQLGSNVFPCDQAYFAQPSIDNNMNERDLPKCCCWPPFEEVFQLEQDLEQMPAHRLKQFLFLHSIVNSSSDDSQFTDSGTESEEYLIDNPPPAESEFYQFDMLEVPIPLNGPRQQMYSDHEEDLRRMLTEPQLTFYSVPLSVKHLLCTHDNLMGLCENITLERIVRRRTLSEIVPMSSEGIRQYFPLESDFSSSKDECNGTIDIHSLTRALSKNFHRKVGSFFNTSFQFSYRFTCGKFFIRYGVFGDNLDIKFVRDFIELHAFSRYLPEKNGINDDKGFNGIKRKSRFRKTPSWAWKTFLTMPEVFAIIDYMLRGKFNWIQNNRKLLKYISKGGSIKVAAKQYDTTVKKNQQRILSNVRKYIRNKELMPFEVAIERNLINESQLEFHTGLYNQILGYYENTGKVMPLSKVKMYVIELKDLEKVISRILAKYVYEQYEVIVNHTDDAFNCIG